MQKIEHRAFSGELRAEGENGTVYGCVSCFRMASAVGSAESSPRYGRPAQ